MQFYTSIQNQEEVLNSTERCSILNRISHLKLQLVKLLRISIIFPNTGYCINQHVCSWGININDTRITWTARKKQKWGQKGPLEMEETGFAPLRSLPSKRLNLGHCTLFPPVRLSSWICRDWPCPRPSLKDISLRRACGEPWAGKIKSCRLNMGPMGAGPLGCGPWLMWTFTSCWTLCANAWHVPN